MKILKCLYRQQQQSLINCERCEMLALFEIEHNGHTGRMLYEAEFHKRDAEETVYTDVPGIDGDTIAYGFRQDPPFYLQEAVWQHEPEATEQTDEVKAKIGNLYEHRI
jgi:hypothetical protein